MQSEFSVIANAIIGSHQIVLDWFSEIILYNEKNEN